MAILSVMPALLNVAVVKICSAPPVALRLVRFVAKPTVRVVGSSAGLVVNGPAPTIAASVLSVAMESAMPARRVAAIVVYASVAAIYALIR